MGLLDNRFALITGAARGLGLSMAERFIAEGARVAISDVSAEALEQAKASLGSACVGTYQVDVTSEEGMRELVSTVAQQEGSLDVMVNNAGITRDATMRKMTSTDFDEVIGVHLRGTWLGTKFASQVMREQSSGGSIINISSISGKVGNLGQTNYSAAKAGIVGLTKAAAKEVAFANVRINAIQPGFINTAMTAKMRDDIIAEKIGQIPMQRAGEPSEVASVATFLASDLSSYVTGEAIEVTGGRFM